MRAVRRMTKCLSHLADFEAWKNFHMRYPECCKKSRNVRLGLASDDFNPFFMMSSTYDCWHVVLIPYNLPPWMCLKKSSLMLSTLIHGPSSKGITLMSIYNPLLKNCLSFGISEVRHMMLLRVKLLICVLAYSGQLGLLSLWNALWLECTWGDQCTT